MMGEKNAEAWSESAHALQFSGHREMSVICVFCVSFTRCTVLYGCNGVSRHAYAWIDVRGMCVLACVRICTQFFQHF